MRIVQMISTLSWGGAQKMLLQLVRSLQPMGVEVTVINLRHPADPALVAELELAGATVKTFHFPRLFSPVSFLKLVQFIKMGDFDFIQAYLPYGNIISAFAGFLTRTPVIGSLRTAGYNQKRYSLQRDLLDTFSLKYLSKRVLANGERVADFARKRLGNTEIDVIANAVDIYPDLPEEKRNMLRSQLVGDMRKLIILSVGRLDAPKGFPDLIQAFSAIHVEHPNTALVIAGEGRMAEILQKQIVELNLSGHAFLLGLRTDISDLMGAADVYVNSSHWEGMAVSILEAMAAGLPVVATAVGDSPRIVSSEAGILVPPRDPDRLAAALKLLIDSPAKRKELGLAGRMHIKSNYGLDAWLHKMLRLYSTVSPVADQYLQKSAGA